MPLTQTSIKELLASGVHFGHKSSRWNPKMKPYIFGKHSFVHIIDIKKTIEGLVRAHHFIKSVAARNETILFVGTKRQAKNIVKNESHRAEMPYVSERWLGGALTNFSTIRSRLKRLDEIETWEKDGRLAQYSKKEQSSIMREKRRLLRNLGGIRKMDKLPSAMVIIDPVHEKNAIAEAKKLGVATVALIDTDGDPDSVDIPVPGNDDSMKVIQIILSQLADAVIEGRKEAVKIAPVEKPVAPKEAAVTPAVEEATSKPVPKQAKTTAVVPDKK